MEDVGDQRGAGDLGSHPNELGASHSKPWGISLQPHIGDIDRIHPRNRHKDIGDLRSLDLHAPFASSCIRGGALAHFSTST
jgi:hypothetical protein